MIISDEILRAVAALVSEMAVLCERKKASRVMLDWESMRPNVGSLEEVNKLIWDSEKEYPFKLSSSILKLCGDPKAKLLDFIETRCVLLHRKKRKVIKTVDLE